MAVANIPEVIHDFNLYYTDSKKSLQKLVGVSGEVTLPTLEAMTQTISGPGILGEYETAVPGHYGPIEMEIPFRCTSPSYFVGVSPSSPMTLTLRGAMQLLNPSTGVPTYTQVRILVKGRCKSINLGQFKQTESMNSSITLALTYFLLGTKVSGGTEIRRLELDKINGVFKVNDKDQLAAIRKLT